MAEQHRNFQWSSTQRIALFLAALIVATISTPLPAHAEPSTPVTNAADSSFTDSADRWRVHLTPLLWIAGVDGSSSVRQSSGEASVSFDDIAANLEFGFMLHAEVEKGKFAILFDGLYIDIGTEGSGPVGGDVDGQVRAAVADLSVAYQVAEIPMSNTEATPRAFIDVIAGVRYVGLEVGLEPEGLASRSVSEDIFDPYVGARARFAITRRLSASLKGTIGGFGVGSDLDWTAGAFVDYRLADWCSILAGYHVMGLEFDDVGDVNGLEFDAVFHGPVVGLSFHF